MKSIKIAYLPLIALLGFGFQSCEDEPLQGTFADELIIQTDANNSSNFVSTFTAKIDDVEFEETSLETRSVNADPNPNYIEIVGIISSDNQLNLAIPTSFSIGNHNFGNSILTGTNARGFYLTSGETRTSNAGTLIITEKSASRIKGSFQFTVKNPTGDVTNTITEGSFDVAY